MKTKPITPTPRHGVTLIELTVVIAVILLLLSVLLLGGKFYINSASRSGCIVNINGIHKTIRSVQNMEALKDGDDLSVSDITGAGKPLDELPQCPLAQGSYTLSDTIVPIGQIMVFCEDYDPNVGVVDATQDHTPGRTISW